MQSTLSPSAFKRKASGSMKLLMLLMIVSMVLAACGGGSGNNNSGSTKVVTVVNAPNGDWVRNFNPLSTNPMDGTRGPIYETLLFFNRMDGSITPWLASEYNVSEDAKVITFTIRDSVKWSDGEDFTADDVVFTLNYMKEYETIDTNGLWKYIDTVGKEGENKVVVTLKVSYSPILWQLGGQSYMVPEHIWKDVKDPAKAANENPVGTGPFVLKAFTPQLITLEKNTNYWQAGKPYVDEVRYPAYNSNTNSSLVLSRGDLDYAGLFTPDIEKTYVDANKEHHKYWFPPSNVVMYYLNLTKAPFNDLKVRQALSAAIDRQNIVDVAENGYTTAAHPTGVIVPANDKYLNPEYADASFEFNPEKSMQLLEEAGFTKGADGIYTKDGQRLSFKIHVVSGWNDWVTAAQIMAENFKAIGVEATVNAVSYNSYVSDLQNANYDTAISWTNGGPTPFYLLNGLLNSQYGGKDGNIATSNFGRWIDEDTDKILDEYATTADEKAQQEALNKLQALMVEEIPAIGLFYGPYWYEYNTERFTGWPDENNPYAAPPPWSYPDTGVVLQNIKPVED